MGSHSLLQGLFSTQGSSPSLLHCRQILYCLRHQGSPNSTMVVAVVQSQESDTASIAKSCLTLATSWTVACQASLSWDSLGKNTGAGCHFLLQYNHMHIYIFIPPAQVWPFCIYHSVICFSCPLFPGHLFYITCVVPLQSLKWICFSLKWFWFIQSGEGFVLLWEAAVLFLIQTNPWTSI